MPNADPSRVKNREIEALRAVAILLTLVQHLPILLPWPDPPAWLKYTYDHLFFWGGVDLFFVISGYVVTRSLLHGFASTASSGSSHWSEVKRFWLRRAFRLFPLAWLWVGIVLLATYSFNDSGVFGSVSDNAEQALWILLYVYNWFAYGLFAAGINIAPLGVYWSLAIEEQFYLLLPLLLLALPRRVLFGVLGVAIAAQFFVWRPAPWLEPMWGLRFDALLWGVLLAYFAGTPMHAVSRPACMTSSAGRWLANGLLLAGITVMPAALMKVSCTTGLLAVVCTLYVWLASFQCGYVLPATRFQRLLDWLGARSYAIYVMHVVVFMLIREGAYRLARANGGETSWGWATGSLLIGLVLVFIGADICHRIIERPLRDFGRRIANKII